ncbi:MAG: hypothetical protein WA197_13730 [Candidatus Acidiferrales bacterium]
MPPTQLKSSAKKDPCPEDELLVAFSENRLGGFVWDAVAEHLTRCGECAELQQRLLKFSSAAVTSDQPEWGQAEKRLENWMDAFLQTHATDVLVGEPAKPVLAIADRLPATAAASWNFRWAWSAVAGLAAVACAVVVLEFVPALLHRGEPQVATQNPASAAPNVAQQSGASAGPEANASTSRATNSSATAGPVVATVAQPGKPSQKIDSNAPLSASPSATRRYAANPPADPAGAALRTATQAASQLASAVGAAITSASGETQPSHDGSRPVPASRARSAATHSALPGSISLLENTLIRIQLTAGSIPSDGSFEFRGTLLEPAIPVIGLVLGRDTEIRGMGTVQNGEISVVINEVIIRGVHYPLKAGSGAAKAVRVGSGDALRVSFDQGSVYEKVSRASSTPAAGSVTSATDDGRF